MLKLKKRSLGYLLGIILLSFLVLGVTGCKREHHLSADLMRQGKVTQAFKNAHFTSDVVFYDPKTTPDIAKANFDTDEYQAIDLLMYSDGCKTCNHKKETLVKNVKRLVQKKHLVILINSDQNLKPLRAKFKFPADYNFPTVFSFTKNSDGDLFLSDKYDLALKDIE